MFQTPPEKILGILNPLETPKNPYTSKKQTFRLNPALLASNAAFAIIYILRKSSDFKLFEKQHGVTQKSNKSNKNNTLPKCTFLAL